MKPEGSHYSDEEMQAGGAFGATHCANHGHWGCDPDAKATQFDVYRGEEFLQTAYFCGRCRAALILEGFDTIIPGDGRQT